MGYDKPASRRLFRNSVVTANRPATHETNFSVAVNEFVGLSKVQIGDIEELFAYSDGQPEGNETWVRHTIRGTWALAEGYAESVRMMCAVLLPLFESEFTESEAKFVRGESRVDALDRLKRSIKLADRIFKLNLNVDFGGVAWQGVVKANLKRDLLAPQARR